MPNPVTDHDIIVQYNRENGTNFYNIKQVNEDKLKKAEAHKVWANDDETVGSSRFRATNAAAHNAATQKQATKIALDAAKRRGIETAAMAAVAAAPHILPVIANPATASTTAGAVAATGLDASGLAMGLNQLNNYWNNRKNLTWKDTPGILLSGLSLLPGSSQLTNPRNWNIAANAVKSLNPAFKYRSLLERVKVKPELAPHYNDAASARQNTVDNFDIIRKSLADGTLRFGEPTTYNGVHQSSKSIQQFEFPYQRWDVVNHGADPNGAFFTLDKPAEAGFLSERPYTSYWEIKSQKPLIQTGEIRGPGNTKNNVRNAIVDYARRNGADAVEFRGIADNNLKNQNILFATDKSGIRFKYESPVTEEISIVPRDEFMATKQVLPGSSPISEAERLGIPNELPLVNTDAFRSSSIAKQNKFWKEVKNRINPENPKIKLKVQDQQNVKEIEDELSSIFAKKMKKDLPVNMATTSSGDIIIIPGNKEEIARTLYGLENKNITLDNGQIVRAHAKDLNNGSGSSPIWFGGIGDQGVVLNYATVPGMVSLDMQLPNYNVYHNYARTLEDYLSNQKKLIDSAWKANDLNSAAEEFVKLLSVPESTQKYLKQRMLQIKPLFIGDAKMSKEEVKKAMAAIDSENTKAARDMFRAAMDTSVKPTQIKSILRDGRLNLEDPRLQIFTGDPERMHKIIGGYYPTVDAKYVKPDFILPNWQSSGKYVIANINKWLNANGLPMLKGGYTTDSLGKIILNGTDSSILEVPVNDFHGIFDKVIRNKTTNTDIVIPPKLIMIPRNKIESSIYRVDANRIGLKHGGKLNIK